MKRANKVLSCVMIGNIVMFIISIISVCSGFVVMVSSSKIANAGVDLMTGADPENTIDGWGALGGFLSVLGAAAIALVGMFLVFGGFIATVMYGAAMINSIITKVGATKLFMRDEENCRKRMMTTGIVSTVMNSIALLAVFIAMLATGTIVYVFVILMFIIATVLTFSIMEIVVSQKIRWYIISTVNKQIYEDVETKSIE